MYIFRKGAKARTVSVSEITPEIRQILYGDLLAVDMGISNEDKRAWLKCCERRFDENHLCWGVLFGGEVVSVLWIAMNGRVHITEVDQYLDVDDDAVYLYDAQTHPRCRGKRFYPYLLASLCNMFLDRDRWIGSLLTNKASISGIHKVGFETDHIRYLISVLGIRARGVLPTGSAISKLMCRAGLFRV
ncbi:MAG: hypothetical protein L0Y67_06995 [Gammaproteobacteria bacterium]|nr:hypothetical protein [Gammaproteobacteria bacterium]